MKPSAAVLSAAVPAAAALLVACGGGEPGPPPPPPDESAPIYDPDRVLEVGIEMLPADWAALRGQTRPFEDVLIGEDCLADPFESPFTWFGASVTIDGEAVADVGIRKKGFLGSLDDEKPSLKLKFDAFEPGRELFGLERLTLNNSKQDPSFVDQCLGYAIFRAAGLPAPRCNFAHVVVNGEDLGLYVNVESTDKHYLRRWFADDSGDLWEGTLSDFRPGWMATFDKKTNELDPDRSALEAVAAAAAVEDAALEEALAGVIDLDGFYTFWAVESLVQHWDGYAGNTNNFYVYEDPASGVFHFLPWGTDQLFAAGEPPTSVYGTGVLSWRLYRHPAGRATYLARLEELLDTVWDEGALLDEVDRLEALVVPVADPDGTLGVAAAIDETRTFIAGRRAVIEAELAPGPPAYDAPLRDSFCIIPVGDASGTFSTTFDTLGAPDPFASGTGTYAATVGGVARSTTMIGSMAGWDPDVPVDPNAMIQVVALLADGTVDVAVLVVTPEYFVPGTVVQLDWANAFGAVFNFDPATGLPAVEVGYFLGGAVQIDEAGVTPGAPVSGSFVGQLVLF